MFATSGNARPFRLTGRAQPAKRDGQSSRSVGGRTVREPGPGTESPRWQFLWRTRETFPADACARAGKGGSVDRQTSVLMGRSAGFGL